MKALARLTALGAMMAVAGCAAPEYRWVKAGVDAKKFGEDRRACYQYVDDNFNPYYDYGVPGAAYSEQALFRQMAAEDMYRECMQGKGYQLVEIPRQQ